MFAKDGRCRGLPIILSPLPIVYIVIKVVILRPPGRPGSRIWRMAKGASFTVPYMVKHYPQSTLKVPRSRP
jgi:hypothetical protein